MQIILMFDLSGSWQLAAALDVSVHEKSSAKSKLNRVRSLVHATQEDDPAILSGGEEHCTAGSGQLRNRICTRHCHRERSIIRHMVRTDDGGDGEDDDGGDRGGGDGGGDGDKDDEHHGGESHLRNHRDDGCAAQHNGRK